MWSTNSIQIINEANQHHLPPGIPKLFQMNITFMTEAPLLPWQDLLAVGYGEFDLSYQNPGLVCCWSLKNHTVEPSANITQVLPPLHTVIVSCVAVARSIHPLRLRRHLPGFLPQQPQSAGCGDDQWHHCHLWCADSGEQDLCRQQLVSTRCHQVIVVAISVFEANNVIMAAAFIPFSHQLWFCEP